MGGSVTVVDGLLATLVHHGQHRVAVQPVGQVDQVVREFAAREQGHHGGRAGLGVTPQLSPLAAASRIGWPTKTVFLKAKRCELTAG
jgi:hypothetical protein